MKHLLQLSHRGRSEGDVSGVSFPLGEETEIFHRCIYVMMLSALLPAQSYVATAHRPAALYEGTVSRGEFIGKLDWAGSHMPTMRVSLLLFLCLVIPTQRSL